MKIKDLLFSSLRDTINSMIDDDDHFHDDEIKSLDDRLQNIEYILCLIERHLSKGVCSCGLAKDKDRNT